MRRIIGAFCALCVLASSYAFSWPVSAVEQLPGTVIPGQYIVVLKEKNVSVQDILERHQVTAKVDFAKIKGFTASMNEAQLKLLKSDPDVLLVEPDVWVTAFAVPRQQFDWSKFFPRWGSSSSSSSAPSSAPVSSSPASSLPASSVPASSSQSSVGSVDLPTGINRIDAELSPTALIDGVNGQVDVDIAVIDTGVELHTDLNVVKQVEFVGTTSKVTDENGHGTHVAGTAAAKDNGVGVIGVAPGARIWSVKVLDRNGSGAMSEIIAGVDYVTQNASSIEVANLSLGCECTSSALDAALNRAVAAGVTVVVAAGNSNKDATTFAPASNPNVIAVSAVADFNGQPGGGAAATCRTDVDDTRADFSNFGAPVDIAAPGVCIKSTWKGGGYSTISGTSMASPHVAGAAGLYIAKNGKPMDSDGVLNVKNALVNAAIEQSATGGFSGDVDQYKEKMLWVGNF